MDLQQYNIQVKDILHNESVPKLYEEALKFQKHTKISSNGALVIYSGDKTGRSPNDKRLVDTPEISEDIWWDNNIPMKENSFIINRERAIDYLNTREKLYVFDGFAGADKNCQIKVRVICSMAYHALFMHNMLIRPQAEDLKNFKPDFVIFNSGAFPANQYTNEVTSKTSVDICFKRKEMVILGTQYAGEMKKGVFTIMNYLLPKKNMLSMHCSCNEGLDGNNVSLFFGLSGTGKTTLSADPTRNLIGDDEHGWNDDGVFNIEGGCYAKCIDLSIDREPEIYNAIKFGTILENVELFKNRQPNFQDNSITENTRAAYPVNYIENAKLSGKAQTPNNIIFLTCDAFGVLPPVSKLNNLQASYHFISGYTAKVAGTEMGVTEPTANFSACFGAPFMVWHPNKYAELLSEKIEKNQVAVWLVNTGWLGGPYGVGKRISLAYTRTIIEEINNQNLLKEKFINFPIFNFAIPTQCANIPDKILNPKLSWKNPQKYDEGLKRLAHLFINNFKNFSAGVNEKIKEAGPKV